MQTGHRSGVDLDGLARQDAAGRRDERTPGTYTVLCFVGEPEGMPHVMRGMVAEFTVTGA